MTLGNPRRPVRILLEAAHECKAPLVLDLLVSSGLDASPEALQSRFPVAAGESRHSDQIPGIAQVMPGRTGTGGKFLGGNPAGEVLKRLVVGVLRRNHRQEPSGILGDLPVITGQQQDGFQNRSGRTNADSGSPIQLLCFFGEETIEKE